MYTLLLLDDEPLIIESLKTIIPWKELDCTCIGEATDGIRGIELIEKYNPDIVISDIVMPEKGGLEIAEYCEKINGCRLIIISAYSDFAYAQKAMAFGVRHYVLKPISSESLKKAIQESIQDLQKEKEKAGIQTRITADAQELAMSSLLFRIACYGHVLSDIEKEMLIKLRSFRPGVVIGIKFYDIQVPVDQSKSVLSAGVNYFKTAFESEGYNTNWGNSDTMLIFLCFFRKEQKAGGEREEIVRLLDDNIRGMDSGFGMPAAAVSDVFGDLSELHGRYNQCMERLDRTFFYQSPSVVKSDKASVIQMYEPDIEQMLHHMRNGNTAKMNAEFEQWRRWISHQDKQANAMYAFRELYRRASLSATEIGMSEKPQIRSLVPAQFESCRTILLRTGDYLNAICEYANNHKSVVAEMKLMVEQHYMEDDFSLTTIADKLEMNPSYVSRLFKKELQENFSNYILSRRMKQAKFLLSTTDLKIQDIAAQCGFSDIHYFGQVFKRESKMTPKQYRSEYFYHK